MPAFHVVRDHLPHCDPELTRVPLAVERLTLEKRRWRGLAADGVEFGFDLEHALADGDVFFADERTYYQLEQKPEPVIAVALGSAAEAARLGWLIGNLHFRIAVTPEAVLAPNDSAVRQLLDREKAPYRESEAVFRPLSGGHSHGG